MKENLSNLSKTLGRNHLKNFAKELAKPGITDYQKCVLLMKVQPLLESSRIPRRPSQNGEIVSLVTFNGEAKNYGFLYQTAFFMNVSGLFLNDVTVERDGSVKFAYNKLKRRQERTFSQTSKAIQELLDKSPYKTAYSRVEIILENTKKIVNQRLQLKFRKKHSNGPEKVFRMNRFLWKYGSPELKENLRKGEISYQQAYKNLKASIEFPMTVNEFKKILISEKVLKPQINPPIKVPIPVRCLFRMGRIEINWKTKRRASEEVSQVT